MITDAGLNELKTTVTSIKGLRETLFIELDNLRNGKISSHQAKIIARLCAIILDSARLEMEAFTHPLSDNFIMLPDNPLLDI
jgi:hypothetical protein